MVNDRRRELDALLARDIAATRDYETREFDRRSQGRRIVLMGAGGLGRRTLDGLRRHGVEPLAIADNAPALQGTVGDGVRILAPDDAAHRYGHQAAFVVTIWGAGSPHRFADSRRQLGELGCDVILPFPPLFWKYADALLPHYLQDLPHRLIEQKHDVARAFDLWEDDASRAEYVAQVRFRLIADFDGLAHPVAHPQYLPDDLYEWRDDEWVVDGGAYDGDTIRSLVEHCGGRFNHVLALEPDPRNFKRLEQAVASLAPAVRSRIGCLRIALAAASGMLHLEPTGTASSTTGSTAGEGTVNVPAEPLDAMIGEARPTLIKLDIEGAEPDALAGARETIRKHGPVLAICVYHRQDHLWRIPLMLREWREDYAFFLRPHNEEGWDLICYAVPRARLSWRAP